MGNQFPIIIFLGVVAVLMLVFFVVFVSFFSLWVQCLLAGAQVPLPHLIMMRFRKIDVKKLCELYIMSRQAGLNVRLSELESAYLAGADVELVVRAMIKASQTGQNLTWDEALSQAKKNQYDDYVEDRYGAGA